MAEPKLQRVQPFLIMHLRLLVDYAFVCDFCVLNVVVRSFRAWTA